MLKVLGVMEPRGVEASIVEMRKRCDKHFASQEAQVNINFIPCMQKCVINAFFFYRTCDCRRDYGSSCAIIS